MYVVLQPPPPSFSQHHHCTWTKVGSVGRCEGERRTRDVYTADSRRRHALAVGLFKLSRRCGFFYARARRAYRVVMVVVVLVMLNVVNSSTTVSPKLFAYVSGVY